MEIVFFFPEGYEIPTARVNGIPPKTGDTVYFRGVKMDSPFHQIDGIRKWKVKRVDYSVMVAEPYFENSYHVEVHLVPWESANEGS